MFQEFAACRGDTIQRLLERRDNRSVGHRPDTTVLGWKPTFNRFSKSAVGTNPTAENLGGPNMTVNPVAAVFPVFLQLADGTWRMASGQRGTRGRGDKKQGRLIGSSSHKRSCLTAGHRPFATRHEPLWSDLHKFFSGHFRRIPLIDLFFRTVLPTISVENRRIQPDSRRSRTHWPATV